MVENDNFGSNILGTIDNEHFLNEDTLNAIYMLLQLNQADMFDEIDTTKETWRNDIDSILKKRLEIYTKKVEIISSIYQQNIPNN